MDNGANKMNELLLKTFYLSGTYECEAHAKQLLENPIINMKNFKKLCEFNPYLVQNIILEHEKMKYFEIRKKLESERLEHDLLFYLEAYKDKIDSDFKKFFPNLIFYDEKIQSKSSIAFKELAKAFKGE